MTKLEKKLCELGYKIELQNDLFIEIGRYNEDYETCEYISINFDEHTYEKYLLGGEVMHITMQEHKLLNELFNLWGWL